MESGSYTPTSICSMVVRFRLKASAPSISHVRVYEMMAPFRSSSGGGAHVSESTVPFMEAVKFAGEPLGAAKNYEKFNNFQQVGVNLPSSGVVNEEISLCNV